MFNADPDAVALKWDETWCYTAVLIRRQACMHVYIHSTETQQQQQLGPTAGLISHAAPTTSTGTGRNREENNWENGLKPCERFDLVKCFMPSPNLKCITHEQ